MEIKKGYAFVILFLFVATIAESQPNNAPDCHPDGPFISTAPLPYSGQSYQTNTWNWMQEHLYASNNYNYVDESNLNTPPGLENPFYLQTGNQYLSNLAYGDNSDFYPVDGWQLIKRDFGQLYNTTQNDQCSPAPYFILYNKYSGRLRVIASAYGLGDNQLVDIDLHFMEPGNWRDLNLTNYGTSGLFAHYGNVTSTLDVNAPEIGTLYTTPAIFPSSDYSFFYGDFQMAYDPCTCEFQSGLQIDFKIVNTFNVNLGGNIIGNNIPITDNSALNQIDPKQNWLASVSNNNYNVNNGLLIYNNMDSLAADFAAQTNAYTTQLTNARIVGSVLGGIGSVLGGSGQASNGVGTVDSNNPAEILAGGWLQAAGGAVSFLGAQLQQYLSPTSPPTEPMVLYAQAQMTGTISESTTIGAGTIDFGTPGSAGSPSLPEVSSSSPNNVPPYPEYDEILGVFALLQAPYVIRYNWTTTEAVTVDGGITYTDIAYTNCAYTLRSPADIQYTINPATNPNLNNTIIQAAWEDDWIDPGTSICLAEGGDNNLQTFGPSVNMIPEIYADSSIDYISPFVDLAHFQNLYVCPPVATVGTNNLNGAVVDYLGNIMAADSLFIKFNIVLMSNDIGHSGRYNTSIFTLRYQIPPDHIINQTISGPADVVPNGNFYCSPFTGVSIVPPTSTFPGVSLPNFVNIPAQTLDYTINTPTVLTSNISGYYNIYINANLSSSTPITITASNSIIVATGVIIDPNITLTVLPYMGIPAGSAIPPVSNDAVTAFCTSNTYKANTPLSSPHPPVDPTQPNQQLTQNNNNFNFNLYPNPANSECTARFALPANADVTITITDMMGRDIGTLDHSQHFQGTSFVPFNTAAYAPGMYLIRFTDGTNVATKKLTISR